MKIGYQFEKLVGPEKEHSNQKKWKIDIQKQVFLFVFKQIIVSKTEKKQLIKQKFLHATYHLWLTLGNVHNLPSQQKQKWDEKNNKNATEEQKGKG